MLVLSSPRRATDPGKVTAASSKLMAIPASTARRHGDGIQQLPQASTAQQLTTLQPGLLAYGSARTLRRDGPQLNVAQILLPAERRVVVKGHTLLLVSFHIIRIAIRIMYIMENYVQLRLTGR
jgi:hypothetical protein